jgi:hypothetical protein
MGKRKGDSDDGSSSDSELDSVSFRKVIPGAEFRLFLIEKIFLV